MTYFESRMNSNTSRVDTSFTRGLATCVGGFLLACLPLSFLTPSSSASVTQMSEATMEGGLAAATTPGADLWGDDTIGALPIVGGGGSGSSFLGAGPSLLNMIMLASQPSMIIEGSIAEMQRTVVSALGDVESFVFLEPTTPGNARLFIQGASTIELDRQLFLAGDIKVSMFTGFDHARNSVTVALSDKSVSSFTMFGGSMLSMELAHLVSRGLLDFDTLDVTVQGSPRLATGHLRFQASAHTITLNQQQ